MIRKTSSPKELNGMISRLTSRKRITEKGIFNRILRDNRACTEMSNISYLEKYRDKSTEHYEYAYEHLNTDQILDILCLSGRIKMMNKLNNMFDKDEETQKEWIYIQLHAKRWEKELYKIHKGDLTNRLD